MLLQFSVSPPHNGKMVPFEDFFHLGKQKVVIWGKIRWIGRAGHGGHDVVGQKLLNTQCSVGSYTCTSAIMKWSPVLKESSQKSLKLNAASHNNSSWYTDTDGFLELPSSGGSLYYKGPALQKVILFWGKVPPKRHDPHSPPSLFTWSHPEQLFFDILLLQCHKVTGIFQLY